MSLALLSFLLLPAFHTDAMLGAAVFGGFEGGEKPAFLSKSGVEGGGTLLGHHAYSQTPVK